MSPTTPWISTPGYSSASFAALERSVASSTSSITNRSSEPRARNASSRMRVFVDVPAPSSTSVSAPEAAAISPARSSRIERSRRVR